MSSPKQLHWSSRVALVRHNLHAASRSGDFCFFKSLQANGFVENINHVATLSAELGDDADALLAAMDNLNAGLAYIHQDAFKNVYDNLKDNMRGSEDENTHRSKLFVDITMQKSMADMSIDKTASSAIALINQQPANAQDSAANVWMTGATIASDCMQVCLQEMMEIEGNMDDFIRLEESWNSIKASVTCTIASLKGVFSLMDSTSPVESQRSSPRNASVASTSSSVFRRLSNAFAGAPGSVGHQSRSSSVASAPGYFGNFANHSRNASVSSTGPVYRTPNYVRRSVSTGCPTSLPPSTGNGAEWMKHKLSVIPPTPAVESEERMDPFDNIAPPVPEMPKLPDPTALRGMDVGPAGEIVSVQ